MPPGDGEDIMALYHLCVKQIKRSEGHSAVAAAAYRAGEMLYDEYYDVVEDYTQKEGVVESFILLPEHVPERLGDRQTLWNEVEKQENRRDAQLAYSFDMALQKELTPEDNREILLTFLNDNFISRGMICDVAIHDPPREPGQDPNRHAHVLCPMRPVMPNGEWGAKRYHVPLYDEDGDPVLDKYGKQKYDNPFTTDWGRAETLEEWRRNWELIVNAKFEEKGLECRIDHRSNAERGIDDVPQVHEGSAVRQMEKRGIVTYKSSWNKWVKKTNNNIHRLLQMIKEFAEWIKEAREEVHRIKDPFLVDMIMKYHKHRNEIAEGFERGVQKAQCGNLKLLSQMVAFIHRYDLTDMESLERLINKKNEELYKLYEGVNAKKNEVKELKKNIQLVEDFYKIKPVYDDMAKIFFKGRRKEFQDQHHSELNSFYKARRLLKEMGHEEADLNAMKKRWEKQIEQLTNEIESETGILNNSELKQEMKILSHIRKAVDYAIGKESKGDGREIKNSRVQSTSGHIQPDETVTSRERERVSLKKQIKDKKEIVDRNKKTEQTAREQEARTRRRHEEHNL